MRAKPEMKPWVYADKSGLSSVGAALSVRAFVVVSTAPLGLISMMGTINPGGKPLTIPECRPCRAYLHFYHQSITLLF